MSADFNLDGKLREGHVIVLLVSWKADDRSRQCPNERRCTETILSCTAQYYSVLYMSVLYFMNISSRKRLKVAL
jgi:hypothetical protein